MTQAWRTLTVAGGLGLAFFAAPSFAEDVADDEAPVQAPKPDDVDTAAKPALVVPAPAAVNTAPMWVGDYRVGHIHRPALAHIFYYSAWNPHLDALHEPMRTAVHGDRHARYYAGYRLISNNINWNTYYLPTNQCYAPGAYGYHPGYVAPPGALANAYDWSPYQPGNYATPYAGYGRAHTSYYGGVPGAGTPAAVPPSGINVNGFRYTGDPAVYSPYGVGSSSYFGAYGAAGY